MHFSLDYSFFFSIDSFFYKEIFLSCEQVWEALCKLPSYIASQKLGDWYSEPSKNCFLVSPEKISIGKNTIIEPGAFLEGPSIIGEDVLIRSGAYVRKYSLLGKGVIIGHGTEVKNSILLNGAHAAHFSYVGDSILGKDVNLGAGVKCANLRLDKKKIALNYQGKIFQTNLEKMGAIIGDYSQIGCNAVLNPGTFLAKHSLCRPLQSVKGFFYSSKSLERIFYAK